MIPYPVAMFEAVIHWQSEKIEELERTIDELALAYLREKNFPSREVN